MEPVGLGIGVIGLAGLFTACLDAIDRAKAYKSYAFDSEALRVQFDGHKLRLEEWGRNVGLTRGQLEHGHHGRLDDSDTRKLVEDILNIIRKVIEDGGGTSSSLSARKTAELDAVSSPERPLGSTRQKLSWALGGKGNRANQIALLGALLDQLHNLVPPTQNNLKETGDDPLMSTAWIEEIRQVLADFQGWHCLPYSSSR